MTPQEFQLQFQSVVRVKFNWTALASSDWPIELRYLTLPEQSDYIYTPWYAGIDGSACNYNSPNAKPQSVAAVALNNVLLSHHGVLSAPPPESVFLVPAYRLSPDSIMLLDGNHRVVSSQVANLKKGISAFVINGPINKRVLPDLVHWT